MTIDEYKSLKEEKYNEYIEARENYNKAISQKYVDKYKGQYIKWSDTTDGDINYMYVYNIWNSIDNDGTCTVDILYFEGVYFSSYFCEYADCTYFNWTQFMQQKFMLYDFNDDTLEYRKGYDNKSLMQIISKDEYMNAFMESVEQMKKEHSEFEYVSVK